MSSWFARLSGLLLIILADQVGVAAVTGMLCQAMYRLPGDAYVLHCLLLHNRGYMQVCSDQPSGHNHTV